MQFNSLQFMIFFPIVVVGYFVIPDKHKNKWLLALSYYFYMCWNAVYALLIFFSTFSTWICGNFVDKPNARESTRKLFLGINVTVNLLILFFFKYYGMFADLVSRLFGAVGIAVQLPALSVLLPVGISFYTFQALGYSIDVYRKKLRHERNFLDYALFVSFFPQLVAGPIERSENLLPQLKRANRFTYNNFSIGMRMMLLGFFKKVVIADNISVVVDRFYDNLSIWPGPLLILGVVLFTLQVYCDFSAYSEIARGAAKVMGFDLMLNFDHPFFSRSVTEFWRRWHISLGGWFRDYLYIPLGGNRKGNIRTYVNLFTVFLVSGLWHGASYTFVIWGGMHGAMQVVERFFALRRKKLGRQQSNTTLANLARMTFTFAFVVLTMTFFRSETFSQAAHIVAGSIRGWGVLASPAGFIAATVSLFGSAKVMAIVLASAVVLGVVEVIEVCKNKQFHNLVDGLKAPYRWAIYYAFLFAIAVFGCFQASAFIYFQF